MAAEDTLRVDPLAMRGFSEAVSGRAEDLRNQFAELNGQVGEMLGGWRGISGTAYASAWELWHRGAGEVEVGPEVVPKRLPDALRLDGREEAGWPRPSRVSRRRR